MVFSESRLWECRVFAVFADKSVMFECNFTVFSESRLWECRVFTVFADKCVMF